MKFFLLINVKMPTVVGISTFMSGKNSILGVSKPKNVEFLYIFILLNVEHGKSFITPGHVSFYILRKTYRT